MFYVIRQGDIKGAYETEEEAEECVQNDLDESRAIVMDDYGYDEDTSEEDISYTMGREFGVPYIEEIDVESLDEDEDYETEEGDTFTKGELEEWLES